MCSVARGQRVGSGLQESSRLSGMLWEVKKTLLGALTMFYVIHDLMRDVFILKCPQACASRIFCRRRLGGAGCAAAEHSAGALQALFSLERHP